MTTKNELQDLLRFLSQDAKIPLPLAMSKIKDLQAKKLTSAKDLAQVSITVIQAIFPDEKQSKTLLAAAKRVTKKRKAGDGTASASPVKKAKSESLFASEEPTPAAIEASLALPVSSADEDDLKAGRLHSNRAPLVLAFAVIVLKYTMPAQPLSSRLSLAQAVVSVNSRSKAVSLGLAERGTGAEDEGWGSGQPGVKVMGREVKVMRRHGYEWREKSDDEEIKHEEDNTDYKAPMDESKDDSNMTALWGLDLEALRAANNPLAGNTSAKPGRSSNATNDLPIYSPQNARSYLLKSFATAPSSSADQEDSKIVAKKPTAAALKLEKEQNLGRLLAAIDLLCTSWAQTLSREELDRRAWSWYIAVRPDVQHGVEGWGGKNEISLAQILDLRRKV